MKKIELYLGRPKRKSGVFAYVDDEDYDRISMNDWYLMKFYHCDTDIKYARRYIPANKETGEKQKHVMMHREIMKVSDRDMVVDHIDHNGLNNQKSNIRICTHSDNMSYRRQLKKIGKSKYKGISMDKNNKTWNFTFIHDGIRYSQSGFKSELDAVKMYNKELVRVKGEFACINNIDNNG